MPSSVVNSFSYNRQSAALTIRYVSGLVYRYKAVPEKIFKEFKAAESKGRYLNLKIKGKFEYEKLSDNNLGLETEI